MRDLGLRSELAEVGVHFLDTAISPLHDVTHAADGRAVSPTFNAWGRDLAIAVDANPNIYLGANGGPAFDAQPGTITAASAGIPAFLTNVISPEVIRVITQPMRAVEILGERKEGNWTTLSAQFPMVEGTGQTASYNDFSANGSTDAQANWVPRQSYHFQTIEQWGERLAAMWGAASLNYKAELDMQAALVINKFYNRSGFYGISGLTNYGLLNDPSLPTPGTPATKVAGGTTWVNATAQEIFQDVLALYARLQTQMGGNLEMTDAMTLVLSTSRYPNLAKVSAFNVSALTTINQTFPNLTIKQAPEYSTGGGELMQLLLPTYDGIRTGYIGFTEKYRAHNLVTQLSSWMQKISAGTWGAIIRRPIAIAALLGI